LKNKDIIIYIPSGDYVLRELTNIDFFQKIKKNFNCDFISDNKIKKLNKIKFSYTKKVYWRTLLWNFSQSLAATLFKKKYLKKSLHNSIYEYNMNIVKKKIFYLINILTYFNLNDFFIQFSKLILRSSVNENILNYEKKKVLLIFGGHSILDVHDLIVTAKKKKIKTVLVMINWDNATKPLFQKPDLVLTWGKQTSIIAKKLNKVNAIPIGTPRFDLIKKTKIKKNYAKNILRLNKNNKYIIYAGKIIPSDDFRLLEQINNYIEKKYKDIIIIYRPHPYGINNDNFKKFNNFKKKKSLNKIVLDSSLNIFGKQDLKQYLYLFSGSDGLISSFSTLTIEAAYYNMPTLCFAINDILKEKRFDYEIGCKYAPHLKILNQYNWPLRAFGYKKFFKKFDQLIHQIKYKKKMSSLKVVKNLVVQNNDKNYFDSLEKIVKNI
jgi:hypothetical protein